MENKNLISNDMAFEQLLNTNIDIDTDINIETKEGLSIYLWIVKTSILEYLVLQVDYKDNTIIHREGYEDFEFNNEWLADMVEKIKEKLKSKGLV